VKEKISKYHKHILLLFFFVFLVHSAKLNSSMIGIDTEDLINLGTDFYQGWLHTGRFGLVALKYLFGNIQFNPYFSGTMTLIFLVTAFAFSFILFDSVYDVQEKHRVEVLPWFLGGALWVSHPILVEQFYFSLQSMEICIGFLFTVFALYGTLCFEQKKKCWYAGLSIIFLLITFSIYQIFVVYFVFGTVAVLLLRILKDVQQEHVTVKLIFLRIVPFAVVFFVAFLLYTLINGFLSPESAYLNNQIAWGKVSFGECIFSVFKHMIKAFSGYHSVFYSMGFGLLAIICFLLILRYLNKISGLKKNIYVLVILLYIALLFTPFMMTMVLGGEPAYRSQLVLPAVTGFCGYLIGKLVNWDVTIKKSEKIIFVCSMLFCLVTSLEQMKVSAGLYYTDKCRYEHDLFIAQDIIEQIEKLGDEACDLPIVVVGEREFVGNDVCVMGEIIGRSFFSYDTEVEPEGFWSTRRALGFLQSYNGTEYAIVSQDKMEKAKEYSYNMNAYPNDGYVCICEDMIVVKLSHFE